jgi:hypothetical protein
MKTTVLEERKLWCSNATQPSARACQPNREWRLVIPIIVGLRNRIEGKAMKTKQQQ